MDASNLVRTATRRLDSRVTEGSDGSIGRESLEGRNAGHLSSGEGSIGLEEKERERGSDQRRVHSIVRRQEAECELTLEMF